MPQDLADQQRKADDAERRLAGFRNRLGTPFALQAELDGKLAQLDALNQDLSRKKTDQADKLAA
jgi:hypothetical protein